MGSKKKVLILSRFIKEYEPVRLKQEAIKLGYNADIIKYGQIEFGVNNGINFIKLPLNKKLSDYSYIIPRSASKKGSSMVAVKNILLNEARKLNIKILNDDTFNFYPLLGKMEQGSIMAQNGIPTIDYISFGSKRGFEKYIKNVDKINFPIIIKGRFGSHGNTVAVANNLSDLLLIASKYRKESVLIQPLLKVKQWYRCIVIKNNKGEYEYLGNMRHRQKEKYNHAYFTHVDEPLTLLSEKKMSLLNNICIRAAKLFNCDYCGIDVLYISDKKQFVVSEVNRTAQFKYFEKRIGVNVAKRLVNG